MIPLHGYAGITARFTGKVCVALGFILGIYGLTEERPALLKTGLALLIVGMVASAYSLYHWARRAGIPSDTKP